MAFGLRASDTNNDIKNDITWAELIKYWRNILTQIASDFASGVATVTPISSETCKQCSFGLACRVVHNS